MFNLWSLNFNYLKNYFFTIVNGKIINTFALIYILLFLLTFYLFRRNCTPPFQFAADPLARSSLSLSVNKTARLWARLIKQ